MKNQLPKDHGLPEIVEQSLVFHERGKPSLTDVQYAALEQGIAKGNSMLVVSPTSTGKTHIALWSIASAIVAGHSAVYLVTHKALAKQKFADFKELLQEPFFRKNGAAIVVATGDAVEDADGSAPSDPLHARLLIATYEKFLGMLSSGGIPSDLTNLTVVCDELQLLGDVGRGQQVEVLLSLLKNSGWRQFVGLSAVLEERDAVELASWLGIGLVRHTNREKHLTYECRSRDGTLVVSTDRPDSFDDRPALSEKRRQPLEMVAELLRKVPPPTPIIVFCTRRKQDTYLLAEQFVNEFGKKAPSEQLALDFGLLPETAATECLARVMAHRVAVHSADLTDEERQLVETSLLTKKLDVVFATTTLAAGVNFPLGAAVFASWHRWNSDRRTYVPIEPAEFHNMAGRVGRMGFEHDQGRIVFSAENDFQLEAGTRLLQLGTLPPLVPRVEPDRFDQLALQLVASGLCHSRSNVQELVLSTFSALREQDRNLERYKQWPSRLNAAIDWLVGNGLLIETSTGRVSATAIGRAVAFSGLLPATGAYLLDYARTKAAGLASLLPNGENEGNISRLAFLLFAASFSSPEFRGLDKSQPTRYLPWPLGDVRLIDADPYADDLVEPVWEADLPPINAAAVSWDWISGSSLRSLEGLAPSLSAGMLREMFVNLAWVLHGMSFILEAASDPRVTGAESSAWISELRKLPRFIRRLARRASHGLPDHLLWYLDLNSVDSRFKLGRHEILDLDTLEMGTPEAAMLGSEAANSIRVKVFEAARPSATAKANWLRDTARSWKAQQRTLATQRQIGRAKGCKNLGVLERYYGSKGDDFEASFEEALTLLKVRWSRLDTRSKTGAPDYLIELADSPPLVVELKTKKKENLVDYNSAVEILSAAEIHGHGGTFCVTVCHPGVDPAVAPAIAACGRLSVVESHDLGEALLRLCEKSLTQSNLWLWLATPGQALAQDLPYRQYS